MTLEEMESRKELYQSVMEDIINNKPVSHILGSDWGTGLPCTDKKAPYIARANNIFTKKFGDVTQYCGHYHID
ncbi:MAG: hypothetical protein KZQ70_03015 [gamma proteobacterium symbiont of Lucinoma myriamae]|nr:hypothetical protein [gamma proteobacterium symbiont of Lucinoma myriamae]